MRNMKYDELHFEQYKMLIDALKRDEGTREASNQLWIIVNSVALTVVNYVQTLQSTKQSMGALENFASFGLVLVGFCFSLLWLSSLAAIKEKIAKKSKLILEFEKQWNSQIFSQLLTKNQDFATSISVTKREMFAPSVFILWYLSLGFLLYYLW